MPNNIIAKTIQRTLLDLPFIGSSWTRAGPRWLGPSTKFSCIPDTDTHHRFPRFLTSIDLRGEPASLALHLRERAWDHPVLRFSLRSCCMVSVGSLDVWLRQSCDEVYSGASSRSCRGPTPRWRTFGIRRACATEDGNIRGLSLGPPSRSCYSARRMAQCSHCEGMMST